MHTHLPNTTRCSATLDSRPASFTCHYLSVATFDDVDIAVTPLRTSKVAGSYRAEITQGDRRILEATVWAIADDVEGGSCFEMKQSLYVATRERDREKLQTECSARRKSGRNKTTCSRTDRVRRREQHVASDNLNAVPNNTVAHFAPIAAARHSQRRIIGRG